MEIVNVNTTNIEFFSNILTDSAKWLDSINQSMWKTNDLKVDELLKKYNMDEMKLCYENGNVIGAYILQWYDPMFWREINKDESGILHKLAVSGVYRKMGYGKKLIASAERLCKLHGANSIRLNCGTFRPKLRNFYESTGFQMVDRVFIDNRDQIRYCKTL